MALPAGWAGRVEEGGQVQVLVDGGSGGGSGKGQNRLRTRLEPCAGRRAAYYLLAVPVGRETGAEAAGLRSGDLEMQRRGFGRREVWLE